MHAERLRSLIAADELLVVPEIYDGLSAAIAEDVGFDAAIMGGFATSATFGIAEPLLSMAELRDHVADVAAATDLPFVVDGATGFGNAAHTYRTVQAVAEAGAAGVFLEDQTTPRKVMRDGGSLELLSTEAMCAKLRAAVDAREDADADIVLLGKTQAATADRRAYETIDDAVGRLNQYFDAGAELGCLYPRSMEAAAAAVEGADGPLKLAAVPRKEFAPSFAEIAELGYAMANTPTVATTVVAKQLHAYYDTLHTDREFTVDADDVTEFKNYVYDLQYDAYPDAE